VAVLLAVALVGYLFYTQRKQQDNLMQEIRRLDASLEAKLEETEHLRQIIKERESEKLAIRSDLETKMSESLYKKQLDIDNLRYVLQEHSKQKQQLQTELEDLKSQATKENLEPSVPLSKYESTKWGLKWLKIFQGETFEPLQAKFLDNAKKIPKVFKATTGNPSASSWSCYEFLGKEYGPDFDHISSGSLCIFKNICVTKSNFWVYGEIENDYTFQHEQTFDWPMTLSATGHRVRYRKFENADDLNAFFGRVTWVEDFSYLVANSWESHITHWAEAVGTIYTARRYLPIEILPNPKKVYLTNHPTPINDWQLNFLKVALEWKSPDIPLEIYQNEALEGLNEDFPLCFKEAAIPGYQYYIFPSTATGRDFKNQAYKYLSLPIPEEVPKVVTISLRGGRRRITNVPEIMEYLEARYPDIEFRTVTFASMTFAEQVRAMHSSGVLMSIHGADCTNLMFLPNRAAILELNPYRWYEARFFGMAPQMDVEYFSYNCGKKGCGADPITPVFCKKWPISGYPPATDNSCRKDTDTYGSTYMHTNVTADLEDLGYVVKEVFGYLGWGPKVRDSAWN